MKKQQNRLLELFKIWKKNYGFHRIRWEQKERKNTKHVGTNQVQAVNKASESAIMSKCLCVFHVFANIVSVVDVNRRGDVLYLIKTTRTIAWQEKTQVKNKHHSVLYSADSIQAPHFNFRWIFQFSLFSMPFPSYTKRLNVCVCVWVSGLAVCFASFRTKLAISFVCKQRAECSIILDSGFALRIFRWVYLFLFLSCSYLYGKRLIQWYCKSSTGYNCQRSRVLCASFLEQVGHFSRVLQNTRVAFVMCMNDSESKMQKLCEIILHERILIGFVNVVVSLEFHPKVFILLILS